MKSLKIAAFAALTVLVFSVPAQSARRDGLNNNILIEDHDDVFFFPHKVQSAHNANRVRMDHSANGTAATVFSKSGKGGWGLGIAQQSPDHAVIDAFYSQTLVSASSSPAMLRRSTVKVPALSVLA